MNLKIAVLEDKENDYRILESALKIWSEGSGNRIELFWYQTQISLRHLVLPGVVGWF